MYNTVNFKNREEIVNSKLFTIQNKKTVLQQYDEIKAKLEYLLPLAKKQVTKVNESVANELYRGKKHANNFKLVTRKVPIGSLSRILTEDSLNIKYKRVKVGRDEVRVYSSNLTNIHGNYAYVPLKGAKKNSSGWIDNTKIYFLDLNKMLEEKVAVTNIQAKLYCNHTIEIAPFYTTKGNSWSEIQVFRVIHNEGCSDNWRLAFKSTFCGNRYSDVSRDYTNIATIFKKYDDLLDTYNYRVHRDKEIAIQRKEAVERATKMKLNKSVTHKFIAKQLFVNEVDLKIDWKDNGTGTFTLGEWDFDCKLQMLCNETNCSDVITKISNVEPSNPFQLFNQLTGGVH